MTRLFVGNLPYRLDQQVFVQAFADQGIAVQNAHLPLDRDTGQGRGFGFIDVQDETVPLALSAGNNVEIGGRRLRVNEATRPESSHSRPARGAVRNAPQIAAPRDSDPHSRVWAEAPASPSVEPRGRRGRRDRSPERDW